MFRTLAVTLLLFASCAVVRLAADAAHLNGWDPSCFSVFIRNDALGPGPVDEWDDLRTFGFGFRIRLNSLLGVEVDYETLTWRGASPLEASRLDTFQALLGWGPPGLSIGPLRLEAALACGAQLFGNLGSALLQERYHRSVGISRPAPDSYDPLAVLAPAGALSARLRWERGLWRAALLAGLSTEPPVGFRCGAGLRLAAGTGGSTAALTLRCLVDPVRRGSPTLARVAASDSGVVLGLDCAAGHLTSSLEHNLSTGVSNGEIGLQFGRAAEGPSRGFPLALEVSSPVTTPAPGQKVLVPVFGPLVRLSVSQAGGWWRQVSTGSTALRFADYGLGLDGRVLLDLGWLEAQAACGLGPYLTVITRHTLGEERSTVLDSSFLAGLRFEPLLRAGFPEKKHGPRRLISGVGVAAELNVPFWRSPFANMAAVKLLLFSEER